MCIIINRVSYYTRHKVGDLVWVYGEDSNGFCAGYGLVVERRVTMLEDAYIVDVYVFHSGVVYRPLQISRLGILRDGICLQE